MRVSVIGQAAFGAAVLERLRDDGVALAGVAAPEPANGRVDPLWSAAQAGGIPLVPTSALKEPAGVVRWREFEADLCLMANVAEFLSEEVFAVPSQGTVQYHPSLLPLHRGKSAINWAIIAGERETGLTVFWPDEGMDSGPVLLQKTCEIGLDDTAGSLYFDRLFPLGVAAMAESVAMVASGDAPRVEQEHALATYEPPCGDRHAQIPWHEPAERVYALIRGCDPQPGAWTRHGDAVLRLYNCRLAPEQRPGRPGEVVDIDSAGFTVRLNGGILRVGRVRPDDGEGVKLPAAQWAERVGLRTGERLR